MRRYIVSIVVVLIVQIGTVSVPVIWIYLSPDLGFSLTVATVLNYVLPGIFRENRKITAWYPADNPNAVWGYTNKHSINSGDEFKVMLSTSRKHKISIGKLEIYRIGYYKNNDRKKVWESTTLEVVFRGNDLTSGAIGAHWAPNISLSSDLQWKSGYYTIDFLHESGVRDSDIAYIVLTDPNFSGDVLVKLSTNTYQAYNAWGVSGFYSLTSYGGRGRMVSFDRPTPPQFFDWEYYYVLWIEELATRKGFKVDYASDFDVHIDDRFSSEYGVFISVGHDEYWSGPEFTNIYGRIFEDGKNTLFLGGNTAYWQVRYRDVNQPFDGDPMGRQMLCFKFAHDPLSELPEPPELEVTAKFHELGRPETMLKGSGWDGNFDRLAPDDLIFSYYVANIDLPYFEGTGLAKGDRLADVVGYEWDSRDPEQDGKRQWDAESAKIPKIPNDDVRVIFSGEVINMYGEKRTAEAVFFIASSGAKVFSSGTIRWPWGLAKPGFVSEPFKRFNENLVLMMLEK